MLCVKKVKSIKSAFLRVCCSFLAFCLVWTQSVLAIPAPAASLAPQATGGEVARPSALDDLDLVQWHVPESLGSVLERWQGKAGKVVFHIQDTHANYEAQMHTAQILEMLLKSRFKDKMRLIAVEGAAGRIQLEEFKKYPDKEILKGIADYFLKQALITGTEFFGIFHEDALLIHGIEDVDLYTGNLEKFLASHASGKEVEPLLKGLKDAYAKAARAVYGRGAAAFMQMLESHRSGAMGFSEYCEALGRAAGQYGVDLAPFGAFGKLLEAIRISKTVDKKRMETERAELVSALERKMVKEDLAGMLGKSLLYRTGRIPAADFYDYLEGLSARYGLDMAAYKNLTGYIRALRLQDGVKTNDLFAECERLQDDIQARCLATPEEKDFAAAQKRLAVLENLVGLKMSRAELAYYRQHRDAACAVELGKFLEGALARTATQTADAWHVPLSSGGIAAGADAGGGGHAVVPKRALAGLGRLDAALGDMRGFYEKALMRDHAIVRNTLRLMDRNKLDVAVLVTGGFHTEGAMELLKQQGISYVVVNPRLTKTDHEELYLARMLNEELPLEHFFSRRGNRLAVASPFSGVDIDRKFSGGIHVNTAVERGQLLQTLRTLYIAARVRALEIHQDADAVDEAVLNDALKEAFSDGDPHMPIPRAVKMVGTEIQILFEVSETDAAGRSIPSEFVVRVQKQIAEVLAGKQATQLANLDGDLYDLLEKPQSLHRDELPAKPQLSSVVPAQAGILQEPLDVEGRIGGILQRLNNKLESEDIVARELDGVVADACAQTKLSTGDLAVLMVAEQSEQLKNILEGMASSVNQEQVEYVRTGTGPLVASTSAGRVFRGPSSGIKRIQEALFLAKLRQEKGGERNPVVDKFLLNRLRARAEQARQELGAQNDALGVMGLRILESLSQSWKQEQQGIKRYLLLAEFLNNWRDSNCDENRYLEYEQNLMQVFQKNDGMRLEPADLMRLYMDSHPQATARDRHLYFQSVMFRFPQMSYAEKRALVLGLFEADEVIARVLAQEVPEDENVLRFTRPQMVPSTAQMAQKAQIYGPILREDDLPSATRNTQLLLKAIMGDKQEIMLHSMSVTKIVHRLAQLLELDPALTVKALQAAQLHDLGKAVRRVFEYINVPRDLKLQEKAVIGFHDEYSGIIIGAIRAVPYASDANAYAEALAKKMEELNRTSPMGSPHWVPMADADIAEFAKRIAQGMPQHAIEDIQALDEDVMAAITGHHTKGMAQWKDSPDARLINYMIQIADETHAMKDARSYVLAQGGKDDTFIVENLLAKVLGQAMAMEAGQQESDVLKKLQKIKGRLQKEGLQLFSGVVDTYDRILLLDVLEQILTHFAEHRGGDEEQKARSDVAIYFRHYPVLAMGIVKSNLRVKAHIVKDENGKVIETLPEQKQALLRDALFNYDSLPEGIKKARGPPVVLNTDAYIDLTPQQIAALNSGAPVILVGRESGYMRVSQKLRSLTQTTEANIFCYFPDAVWQTKKIQNILEARTEALSLFQDAQQAKIFGVERFKRFLGYEAFLHGLGGGSDGEKIDRNVTTKARAAVAATTLRRLYDQMEAAGAKMEDQYIAWAKFMFEQLLVANPKLDRFDFELPVRLRDSAGVQNLQASDGKAGFLFRHEIKGKPTQMIGYLQLLSKVAKEYEAEISALIQALWDANVFLDMFQDVLLLVESGESSPEGKVCAAHVRYWLSDLLWREISPRMERIWNQYEVLRAKLMERYAGNDSLPETAQKQAELALKYTKMMGAGFKSYIAAKDTYETDTYQKQRPDRVADVLLQEDLQYLKDIVIRRLLNAGFNGRMQSDDLRLEIAEEFRNKPVRIDFGRLYPVMENLLKNAYEAVEKRNQKIREKNEELKKAGMPEIVPQIMAKVQLENGMVHVEVVDNGSGIDVNKILDEQKAKVESGTIPRDSTVARMIDDLMQRKTTIENIESQGIKVSEEQKEALKQDVIDLLFMPLVTSGKATGTGIGLDVVEQIVKEAHGVRGEAEGRKMSRRDLIRVETKVGEGTTFAFDLPVVQPERPVMPPETPVTVPGAPVVPVPALPGISPVSDSIPAQRALELEAQRELEKRGGGTPPAASSAPAAPEILPAVYDGAERSKPGGEGAPPAPAAVDLPSGKIPEWLAQEMARQKSENHRGLVDEEGKAPLDVALMGKAIREDGGNTPLPSLAVSPGDGVADDAMNAARASKKNQTPNAPKEDRTAPEPTREDKIPIGGQTARVAAGAPSPMESLGAQVLQDVADETRERIKGQLRNLLGKNPWLFQGIVKEGVADEEKSKTILGELIDLYPEAMLRVMVERGGVALGALQDDAVKRWVEESRAEQSAGGRGFIESIITGKEKTAKVFHLEHVVKEIRRNADGSLDEKGVELMDLEPGSPYVKLLKDPDIFIACYKFGLSPEEFEIVRAKIWEKFKLGPMQLAEGHVILGDAATATAKRQFANAVRARVMRIAEIGQSNILVFPTAEAYRDIWMEAAGDILIALMADDAKSLHLTGRQIDALGLDALQGLGKFTAGGLDVDVIPERRSTMEERALQQAATARSA